MVEPTARTKGCLAVSVTNAGQHTGSDHIPRAICNIAIYAVDKNAPVRSS